jgi:hypothetical protein
MSEKDNWVSICDAAKSLMRMSVADREKGDTEEALKHHRASVSAQLDHLVRGK